jgi:hypothetical protein
VLTLGTTHASKNASVANVLAHYENTGLSAADIVIGEDAYGIWYAGALRPGMSDDRVREFLGSGPSGDWRGRGGTLDLVAVLMVNSEGFPIIASSYIEGDETVVFFSGWFGPEVDDVEEDAIVASLGGGHTPAPEPDFRKLLRSEIRALRALIDERVAPIERDLDLLRPLAAEALAARIDDVLVYDDASTR